MFILILLSIVFVILAIVGAIRGRDGERFDAYFFFMLVVAGALLILPVRHMLFEYRLAEASNKLLGRGDVVVDCSSYFDSLFHLGAAGFVYRGSSVINLEVRTCSGMRDYLAKPTTTDRYILYNLHVLTHEAMHVAGEINEIRTECQAFQRNHRTAMALGVDEKVAAVNARILHRFRSPKHPYYSADCEPGGPLDEQLADAVWLAPN